MEFHAYADLFPLMEGHDFTALCEDIKVNGLVDEITTYEGKILDGRNRYRCCLAASVPPRFSAYTGGSPLQFVVSRNLKRRQLTTEQRAALALKLLPMCKEEAVRRQREGGRSGGQASPAKLCDDSSQSLAGKDTRPSKRAVDEAAKLVGVGSTTLRYAQAIEKSRPDLWRQVQAGEKAINAAYTQMGAESGKPPRKDKKAAEQPVERKPPNTPFQAWERDNVKWPRNPNGDNRLAVFEFLFTYKDLPGSARQIKAYLTQDEMETFIHELQDQPVQPYPEYDYWTAAHPESADAGDPLGRAVDQPL